MDGVGYAALAHAAAEWVEERYGSIAGWVVAALMIVAPFVALVGLIVVVMLFR